MYGITQAPLTANGNISPARFITGVSGNGNGSRAVQASASTAPVIGISAMFRRRPPGSESDDGYCAIADEPLPYNGPGSICKLQLGGNVTNANVFLTTDSEGKGVATAPSDGTTTYWCARALETGVAGDFIQVIVLSPFVAA